MGLTTVLMLASACGSEPSAPSESPDNPAEPSQETPALTPAEGGNGSLGNESLESGLVAVSIDGRSPEMDAQAALYVVEGENDVGLRIAGADNSDNDFVYIDLTLHGIDSTMGPHVFEFGLPDQSEHVANVGLDGEQYYSQSGRIEVQLNANGTIEGTFDMALAPDHPALGPTGEPVYESTDDATLVSGSFIGDWRLSCQSHLPGHQSLIAGGEFCEDLTF
jgi:hypothetical protein